MRCYVPVLNAMGIHLASPCLPSIIDHGSACLSCFLSRIQSSSFIEVMIHFFNVFYRSVFIHYFEDIFSVILEGFLHTCTCLFIGYRTCPVFTLLIQ